MTIVENRPRASAVFDARARTTSAVFLILAPTPMMLAYVPVALATKASPFGARTRQWQVDRQGVIGVQGVETTRVARQVHPAKIDRAIHCGLRQRGRVVVARDGVEPATFRVSVSRGLVTAIHDVALLL